MPRTLQVFTAAQLQVSLSARDFGRSLVIFLVSLGIRIVALAMPHFAHAPRLAVGWFKRRLVVLACSLCWSRRLSPTLPFVCCGCASGGASVLLSCRILRGTPRASGVCGVCGRRARAPLCGPLVASRPPGERKNTTNTHPIPLGHHPVSFELRGPEFWLGYIFFAREVNPQTKRHTSARSRVHGSLAL